jgi:DNA-binding XRE family transcriptional regulator
MILKTVFVLLRIRSNIGMIICQNQAPISEQNYMNLVGPQVRQIRESLNLTQEELAARCNVLNWDISRGTLAKIESQVRRVTDEEVALLAKALRVKVGDLYSD